MLKLTKGKPAFVPIPLGGGAFIRVRPATQTDVEEAGARTSRDLMGLVASSEAAGVLAGVLGDDFNVDALQDPARLTAAGNRLAEIYLVLACQDGWTAVGTEDGTEIETPDAASLALLLADPTRRQKIMAVVNTAVHKESVEKKRLAALPHGEAEIPAGVRTAAPPEIPAPSDEASRGSMVSARDARKSSSRRQRRKGAR